MSNLNITPDNGRITIKGSSKVRINTNMCIIGTSSELPVTIEADFTNVPHHLHQAYLQSLMYQYKTSVNVYNNTDELQKNNKS